MPTSTSRGLTLWDPAEGITQTRLNQLVQETDNAAADMTVGATGPTGPLGPTGPGSDGALDVTGLPSNGTSGSSTVINQRIADAKAAAVIVSGSVSQGLPMVRIPKGRYKVDATILLELIKGFTLVGAGMGATVLYVSTGITLFDLHRVNSLRIQGMTLVASRGATNAGAVPWVDCLIENSCGIHVRERSDDPVQGVSTTSLVFEDVEFVGFHRAIKTSGNIMGDDVTFIRCKERDNFFTFDHQNGQSVNWRALGGEVLGFVDGPEADYNTLLAAWSGGSKPLTAPGASPTIRDGATVRTVAGGGTQFIGTSFITKNTRLLIAGMPTDYATAVDLHGLDINYAPFTFDATSSEIRSVGAETGDIYGHHRSALVRYERPHPVSTDKTNQVSVEFRQERIVALQATWDAIYLTNGVKVRMVGCTMQGVGAPTARLVSLVTDANSTMNNAGYFHSEDSPLLVRARLGRQPGTVGAVWDVTPLPTLDHDIVQATGQRGGQLYAPKRVQDRTMPPGATRQRQIAVLSEIDGTLPRTTASRVILPAGAVLLRVTVVAFTLAGGRSYTYEARTSAAAVLATLTADTGAVAVPVAIAQGQRQNGGRAPWQDVMTPLPDGIVDVLQTDTTAYVSGHVLLEYV